MKTFFTVLAVLACWVIPVCMLFSSSHKSFALIYVYLMACPGSYCAC